MKTKQERIEEMTKERNEIKDIMKLLDKCVSLNPMCKSEVASVLYGNNYRKLPENAVVLTKEEYDKLGLFEENVQEYKSDNGQLVLVKERKTLQKYSTDVADFIRKETAKEILDKLNALMEQYHYKSTAWRNCANFIKETYGVEVQNDRSNQARTKEV